MDSFLFSSSFLFSLQKTLLLHFNTEGTRGQRNKESQDQINRKCLHDKGGCFPLPGFLGGKNNGEWKVRHCVTWGRAGRLGRLGTVGGEGEGRKMKGTKVSNPFFREKYS